ncbi:hypothetical protein JHW43_002862 [Diplocarpon mali]|nr:hypothetical protein JHW43_002862 [Diplocarpon mali]
MAREGTRQATGNAKPRIFPAVTEGATVTFKKRVTANAGTKTGPKKAITTKAAKPVGVTKKPAPAKKISVADKVKGVVKKAEGIVANNPAKKVGSHNPLVIIFLERVEHPCLSSNYPERAAGTKKIKGTDGSKTTKAKTVKR